MKNNSFLSSEEIVKSFLSYLDDSIYSLDYSRRSRESG